MIRRPPRATLDRSAAASDVYKRQDRVEVGLAAQHQGGVGGLTHEGSELGPVAAVDRLGPDVGLGVRRAVPVEVMAPRPPPAPVVLGDGHLEVRGVIGPPDGAVRPPDRQRQNWGQGGRPHAGLAYSAAGKGRQ